MLQCYNVQTRCFVDRTNRWWQKFMLPTPGTTQSTTMIKLYIFIPFSLQALVNPGITVVVSPLLSLMEDQVWSLKNLGIEAELLCSTTDRNQSNAILKMLSESSDACKCSYPDLSFRFIELFYLQLSLSYFM